LDPDFRQFKKETVSRLYPIKRRSNPENRKLQRFLEPEMHAVGAIVVLFSIERQFPKLDVAGSIPVSRSFVFSDLLRFPPSRDAKLSC